MANATYRQPKLPINLLIVDTSEAMKPEAPAKNETGTEVKSKDDKPSKPAKDKVTVVVPLDLMDQLRNAAYRQRIREGWHVHVSALPAPLQSEQTAPPPRTKKREAS